MGRSIPRSSRRRGCSTGSPPSPWSPCQTSWRAIPEATTRRPTIGMRCLAGCSRGTRTTVTRDVEPCTTVRLTTKMSLVSRRVTSSSSSPRRQRTTTGWRGSSSQSPTVVDSSPPPLSTCYQTDHQPCPGTSEELTREDNQERPSPCPAVCVIPPPPPVCACGGTVKVEGGPAHQPRRPTDPSCPKSRDPSPIPCHL